MPPTPCVPCQVIIWDNMLNSMTTSVNTILQHGVSKPSEDWLRRWYAEVDKACDGMKPLLEELTGIKETAR